MLSFCSLVHNYCGRSFGAEEDHEKQATQNMKYQAEDAASRATERVKSAASGNVYICSFFTIIFFNFMYLSIKIWYQIQANVSIFDLFV